MLYKQAGKRLSLARSCSMNAEAGPSSPPLYLKPNGPPQLPPRLASTHDLLARFRLLPAYDKYVRPPPDEPPEPQPAATATTATAKGKAREPNNHPSPAPQTPGGEQDPDDDDPAAAKGEKKKNKNSYKHLIKGIPGKHSMKKDDYLAGIMAAPPKQRMQIVPFDAKTQREAFAVSLDGLKGWNPSVLVPESAQAREDRKKRKELKRLAKAQLHAAQAAAGVAGSPAPTSASATGPGTPRQSVGTPRPSVGTPRPGSTRPSLPPVVVPTHAPQRTGTGTPTSAHPRTTTPHPLSATPLSAGGERGIKREREREGPVAPANGQNGVQTSAPTPVIAAARAGIPGARPRPVKKQRLDMQGQARDMSAIQQQPTPQGV
ncbi:hypothetical protein FB45DRAFT_887266 [Roridomyces roridus]|uniref:Mediator of RNA polymerase II transcription subunit 19 n=1 Tax=Roridomyces roridus TaxID=1738132 RepID=A0AAD7CIX5_9AGAR|nr:hypothetical protein FB45DRAFT_887266 [Roridomyces roridus]